MITTAEADVAVEAVNDLESLRTYFRSTLPVRQSDGALLRIVAFSTEGEFDAYRQNSFSPAYFAGGPGQETVVLGRLAKENFATLRHEFVHALLRSSRIRLPLFLEEGLAEYFAFRSPGVLRARIERLQREKAWSLTALAAVREDSPEYRDRSASTRFYAPAWATVNALLTNPVYRRNAPAFLERMARDGDLNRAVQEVLGERLDQFERAVFSKFSWSSSRPRPHRAADIIAGPADPDSVTLALARLSLLNGDLNTSRVRLEPLTRRLPKNAMLWSLIGEIALREGNTMEARLALRRAVELGNREPQLLRNLAILETNAMDRGALEPVLAMLVLASPDDEEARRALTALKTPCGRPTLSSALLPAQSSLAPQ